jgi:hypothetical protein
MDLNRALALSWAREDESREDSTPTVDDVLNRATAYHVFMLSDEDLADLADLYDDEDEDEDEDEDLADLLTEAQAVKADQIGLDTIEAIEDNLSGVLGARVKLRFV